MRLACAKAQAPRIGPVDFIIPNSLSVPRCPAQCIQKFCDSSQNCMADTFWSRCTGMEKCRTNREYGSFLLRAKEQSAASEPPASHQIALIHTVRGMWFIGAWTQECVWQKWQDIYVFSFWFQGCWFLLALRNLAALSLSEEEKSRNSVLAFFIDVTGTLARCSYRYRH